MSNSSIEAPLTGGSHLSFHSAVEDPEEGDLDSHPDPSPNHPRTLFRQELPRLPAYLTHFVDRSPTGLLMEEVAEEEEEGLARKQWIRCYHDLQKRSTANWCAQEFLALGVYKAWR